MDKIRRRALLGALGALCTVNAPAAFAQATYPARPVRVIVPFGPGGATDIAVRLVSEKLSERLGQRFNVENMPGPGGIAASRSLLGAANDGYTLGVATNGTAVSVSLFKALPFDPLKDFEMVSTISVFEAVLYTSPESPYKSLQDFVNAAKAQPGKLNIGTVAPGSTQHLAAELLKSDAGINVQTIAYKTSADVLVGVLRNDVQLGIDFYTAVRGPLNDKKAVALATSSRRRSTTLPDVPTVTESGVKGYDVTSWNAFYVARGTPPDAIRTINAHVREIVALPDVRKRFADLGLEPAAGTPAELLTRLREDIDKWGKVIEKSGIPKQ